MSYYMFMFYLILLGALAFILLVFIYKNDDLEEQIEDLKAQINLLKEDKQNSIDSSIHLLAEAEEKISNMNHLMQYQKGRIRSLENKNKELVTKLDKAN